MSASGVNERPGIVREAIRFEIMILDLSSRLYGFIKKFTRFVEHPPFRSPLRLHSGSRDTSDLMGYLKKKKSVSAPKENHPFSRVDFYEMEDSYN